MDPQTQRAVEKLRAGELEAARQELAAALLQDRDNAEAWWWLAVAAETNQERVECLRQVLALNPDNRAVARALITLQRRLNHNPRPRRLPAAMRPSARPLPATHPAQPVRRGHYATARFTPRFYPPGMAPERLMLQARPALGVTMLIGLVGLLALITAGWIFRERVLVQLLVLLPVSVTALSVYFLHFLSRAYARYALTSRHLVLEGGIFYHETLWLPLGNIATITCQHHLLGVFFNTGDLLITGQDGREYFLYAVSAPQQFLAAFEQAWAARE